MNPRGLSITSIRALAKADVRMHGLILLTNEKSLKLSCSLYHFFDKNAGEAPDGVDFSRVHMTIGAAKKVEMRERLKNYLEKRLHDSASEFADTMQKENEAIDKKRNDEKDEAGEKLKLKVELNKKIPLREKETNNKDVVHEWTHWQALIDNKRGQIYYYNRETCESSWDRPSGFPDFKLSASKRIAMEAQSLRYLEWQTDDIDAIVEADGSAVKSDSITSNDGLNETPYIEFERLLEQNPVENVDNVVATVDEIENNANQPSTLPIVQQGDWSAYFDIKSGLVFYFNEVSSETNWDPPFENFPRIMMDAGGAGPKVLNAEEAGNISMERAIGYIGVDEMAEALKWEEAKKKERSRKAAKRARETEAKGGAKLTAVDMYAAAKQAEVEKLDHDRKLSTQQKSNEESEPPFSQQKEEEERSKGEKLVPAKVRLEKDRIERDLQVKTIPRQPVRPKKDPKFNAATAKTMVAPLKTRTLYDILQCSSSASRAELKRSYISLAKETHPDALLQNGIINNAESEQQFIQITQAWKVLGDTTSRRRYDRELQAKGISSKAGNLFENWVKEAAKAMDEALAVAEERIESNESN